MSFDKWISLFNQYLTQDVRYSDPRKFLCASYQLIQTLNRYYLSWFISHRLVLPIIKFHINGIITCTLVCLLLSLNICFETHPYGYMIGSLFLIGLCHNLFLFWWTLELFLVWGYYEWSYKYSCTNLFMDECFLFFWVIWLRIEWVGPRVPKLFS